jgi:GntR family transcriptional regulator of arabinose operon
MSIHELPLLYEQIKDSLRAAIDSGQLEAGQALASERELAERHGVSRITAKRAIADLIQEGLLERLPHRKGAFVATHGGAVLPLRLIAVAIDDVRDNFGSRMLRGIEDYLWDRRIHTLICNADRDFAKVEEYFLSLRTSPVSGVIFAPVIDEGYAERNRHLASLLDKAGICYTLIDRYIPGLLCNYAVANHEESSRVLTRRLLDRGYERILLVRGRECTSMDDRVAGYRNAHAEAGARLDERLVAQVDDNGLDASGEGEEAARLRALIGAAGSFDCLYALNDRLLRASVAAFAELGLPLDGSLPALSHGELDPPAFPGSPRMPHFVEPSYKMGWEAAKILVEYINDPGRAIVQKVLKSEFVPGDADLRG